MNRNSIEDTHKKVNNPIDVFLTLAGCILIIIALVLSKMGHSDMVVYSVCAIGVLCELCYKIRTAIMHKKQGESNKKDIIVCVVYVIMIIAVVLF